MNVLFLTHRLPYAPNRGDRIRAFYLLREMARSAEVTLFSFVHDDEEMAKAADMPSATNVATVRVQPVRNALRGLAQLPSRRPMTHCLLDASDARSTLDALVRRHPPDVVVAYCSGMARFAFEPFLAHRPVILDMVDVDSAKWAEFARTTRPPRRWIYAREAATLRAFEIRATKRAVTTLVVNERERRTLLDIVPDGNVRVLPVGIDRAKFHPPSPPSPDPTVVFCGVMDYFPNEDGARWFAQQVWPIVRSAIPNARFLVVGARPTPTVRDLAVRDSSVEVTGAVEAVEPYLWRAAIAVAPLRLARGIQTKVLEALAAGLPVVTTSAVLDGLPDVVHAACDARESAEPFAQAVIDLLRKSPAERRQRAAAARLEGLDWTECLRPVGAILSDAQNRRAGREPDDPGLPASAPGDAHRALRDVADDVGTRGIRDPER